MMTTSDKDLLELAAKAAGVILEYADDEGLKPYDSKTSVDWNPLTDDGDALRLAVKLNMDVCLANHNSEKPNVWAMAQDDTGSGKAEWLENDPYAATRRAIVRAAAAIGESM